MKGCDVVKGVKLSGWRERAIAVFLKGGFTPEQSEDYATFVMTGIVENDYPEFVGSRLNKLKVTAFFDYTITRRPVWECTCDCGRKKIVTHGEFLRQKYKSCGCYKIEAAAKLLTKHGKSRSRVYRIWANMRRRCENSSAADYTRYGGRGIRVCDRWQDFCLFLADMNDPPSGEHSIDRIDNDGHYEPGNCRWATATEQARNRSSNKCITFNGETLCISEWSQRIGISKTQITVRLASGLPVEEVLSSQIRKTLIADRSAEILALRNAGTTYKDIAELLGFHPNAVSRAIRLLKEREADNDT